MELKLNIYNKQRQVVKTYTRQDYNVFWGTIEDFLNVLDVDALVNAQNSDNLFAALGRLLNVHRKTIDPLMFDIFEGLTEEELKYTTAKEIITVLAGVCGFRLDQFKEFILQRRA